MKLRCLAFQHGSLIPKQHTGEGPDVSPPLAWEDMPDGTKSFALICDDPDAPSAKRPAPQPWVHWVIYNIPGETRLLSAGIGRELKPATPAGACQGHNSWPSDNVGYLGPLPPNGSGPHRYFFKLYALDGDLSLAPAQATKQTLLDAMQGHVLAEAELMGTYERQ